MGLKLKSNIIWGWTSPTRAQVHFFLITEVDLSGVARGDPSQAELVFARSFQAYPTLAKYAYLDAQNVV